MKTFIPFYDLKGIYSLSANILNQLPIQKPTSIYPTKPLHLCKVSNDKYYVYHTYIQNPVLIIKCFLNIG